MNPHPSVDINAANKAMLENFAIRVNNANNAVKDGTAIVINWYDPWMNTGCKAVVKKGSPAKQFDGSYNPEDYTDAIMDGVLLLF
jgi:hypothetical protein